MFKANPSELGTGLANQARSAASPATTQHQSSLASCAASASAPELSASPALRSGLEAKSQGFAYLLPIDDLFVVTRPGWPSVVCSTFGSAFDLLTFDGWRQLGPHRKDSVWDHAGVRPVYQPIARPRVVVDERRVRETVATWVNAEDLSGVDILLSSLQHAGRFLLDLDPRTALNELAEKYPQIADIERRDYWVNIARHLAACLTVVPA
jgi:hypothetical protein